MMMNRSIQDKDLFGKRGSFYGDPYRKDYYQEPQRIELAELLYLSGQDRAAERYENCRKSFILSECKDHCGTDASNRDRMFISPISCHTRYCETCARIYGRQWREKVRKYIRSLASNSKRRKFKHIVFQFKNPDVVTSDWISQAMKIVGKLVRKYCCPRFKKTKQFIGGAVAVLEMSPSGYFHVHCLAYCYYIDKEKMQDDFFKLTGDSYLIWIADATKPKGQAAEKHKHLTDIEKADKVLNEVTKYISKPITTPFIEDLFEFAMAIKGRRRIHAWGLFYNNKWLKYEAERASCPYCGGLLKFLGQDDRYDDGEILPAWFVGIHPEIAACLDRYG